MRAGPGTKFRTCSRITSAAFPKVQKMPSIKESMQQKGLNEIIDEARTKTARGDKTLQRDALKCISKYQ
eukprot:6903431-Karenia_brevis.AAC.1